MTHQLLQQLVLPPNFEDAVFDPRPFAAGTFRWVFEGRVKIGCENKLSWGGWNLKSLPRHVSGMGKSIDCVVKKFKADAPRTCTQLHASCSDLWGLNHAAALAEKFNYRVRPPIAIRFVEGMLYQGVPPVCDEDTDSIYFIEPKLDSYVKRNSNTGWVADSDSVANAVAQAFSHWSWCETDGACLVCDLQGTTDLLCTDPVIHSVSGRRMLTDLGESGMCAFFRSHRCNSICQYLEKPTGDWLTRHMVLPAVQRTSYWFESVVVSKTAHEQEGGTCYANAAATLIRSQLLHPDNQDEGLQVPRHSDLLADIVLKYGVNGASLENVLRDFCPQYKLYTHTISCQEAMECVRKGYAVGLTFHWPETQWNEFASFFRESPDGVLSYIPPVDFRRRAVGHAVVLIGVFNDIWELKNSWGCEFGSDGRCKVRMGAFSDSSAKYYRVGICELVQLEQLGTDREGSAVMAQKDRESAPEGMGIVELKDRCFTDSAFDMVLELYAALPNGLERCAKMQEGPHPDGRLVFVPDSDIFDLKEVWNERMQEARRRVEHSLREGGQRRRAPRLFFFRSRT